MNVDRMARLSLCLSSRRRHRCPLVDHRRPTLLPRDAGPDLLAPCLSPQYLQHVEARDIRALQTVRGDFADVRDFVADGTDQGHGGLKFFLPSSLSDPLAHERPDFAFEQEARQLTKVKVVK